MAKAIYEAELKKLPDGTKTKVWLCVDEKGYVFLFETPQCLER